MLIAKLFSFAKTSPSLALRVLCRWRLEWEAKIHSCFHIFTSILLRFNTNNNSISPNTSGSSSYFICICICERFLSGGWCTLCNFLSSLQPSDTLSLSLSIPIQPNPLFLLQKTPLSGFVPCATISVHIVIQLFLICLSTPFLQIALCQYNVCNAHKNENGSHLKLIHHFCRFVHISYESAPRVTLDGISLFPPL